MGIDWTPDHRWEASTMSVQAVLYLIALILLVLAALPIGTRGFSLALLGAAFALAAYAWPVLSA
jgi:hypothetical protein